MANENKFRLKQCEQGCLAVVEDELGITNRNNTIILNGNLEVSGDVNIPSGFVSGDFEVSGDLYVSGDIKEDVIYSTDIEEHGGHRYFHIYFYHGYFPQQIMFLHKSDSERFWFYFTLDDGHEMYDAGLTQKASSYDVIFSNIVRDEGSLTTRLSLDITDCGNFENRFVIKNIMLLKGVDVDLDYQQILFDIICP